MRCRLGLFGLSALLALVGIWSRELPSRDEPRVAGIAREMVMRSDYSLSRLNGALFLEYPPLGYWPMALAIECTQSPKDLHVLFPVALIGIGTVGLTFLMGRILGGETVGLLAGCMLAMMAGFWSLHRRCLVDPVLLFFVTLSQYGFLAGYHDPKGRFRHFALFYLGAACACLSKGLVGLAIPLATAVAFLAIRRDWPAVRRMRPLCGLGLLALPLLLWAAAVWHENGVEVVREALRQSLWRLSSLEAPHAKPFHFYLVPILVVLMPWPPLVLVGLWLRLGPRRIRQGLVPGREALFPALWFCVTFLGLSVASAKRYIYLAPLFPAAALLAALAWSRWRELLAPLRRLEPWVAMAAIPIFAAVHFLLLLPADRRESLGPFFNIVAREKGESPVLLYIPSESLRGAAVFYLGQTVEESRDIKSLSAFLAEGSGRIVVAPCTEESPSLPVEDGSKGLRLLGEKKQEHETLRAYRQRLDGDPVDAVR